MVRAAVWLVVSLALLFFAEAHAQYQGYLPVQTGGCEQTPVTFRSNTWGEYIIWQRDMDTWLVGYPPYQRETQVVDTTCYLGYRLRESRLYWWVNRYEITLAALNNDGTYRWRFDGRARSVNARSRYEDHFFLVNQRDSLDIYRDPDLGVTQVVYVDP